MTPLAHLSLEGFSGYGGETMPNFSHFSLEHAQPKGGIAGLGLSADEIRVEIA